VCVLFWLSWRLAPACSIVILVTALAAAHYRKKTRPVEQAQGRALQRMGAVAHQAFENMRTVRSFAGEALERERFQAQAAASYSAGREFGRAKANFEATNRAAIHASLLMLYSWGGYLVSQGLMPISVLISGIGFTFSLMYATQGAVNTLSDLRRAAGAFERVSHARLARGAAGVAHAGGAAGVGEGPGWPRLPKPHTQAPSPPSPLSRGSRINLLTAPPPPPAPAPHTCCSHQVRTLIQTSDPDTSMFGALPPGAWWEVANGSQPVVEPYAGSRRRCGAGLGRGRSPGACRR
jgi:hypothetical protein